MQNFLFTLIGALILFYVDGLWKLSKEKKERLRKLIGIMQGVTTELEEYRGVITTMATLLKSSKTPTFMLLPEYLEKAKIELLGHPEVGECNSVLSRCHFELMHLQNHINQINSPQTSVPENNAASRLTSILINAAHRGALLKLAEQNIGTFDQAVKTFTDQTIRIKAQVCDLEDNSCFGDLLKRM